MYPIVVEAKSNAVFSLFYRVRDTLESLIDVEGLFSRRYWTKQDEAYEKSERKYEFDQENNVALIKAKIIIFAMVFKMKYLPYFMSALWICK